MKSNWKKCKISDLGTVVGGSTPSTKEETNYGGNISWITPKDLSTFNERYIYNGERNITEKGLKSCSTQLMPKNSVLFTSRAPIGYVAIAGKEMCTNQGFKSVIPNKNTDYLFLYYLLKFNKDNIENMGSGTTFKEVSGTTMKNIEVLVPESKQEQQKIASILSSIDDKVELNNSINNNLEQQAQAIFKSWFVDFEPFGGTMPNNWRNGTFSEVIEHTINGDWGKDTLTGSNTQKVYCIRGADIPEVRIGNKGKMPYRYILPKNYQSKKLTSGDLVVEISGGSPTQSTGRIAAITEFLLNRYDEGMICTNFCKAIKPKENYNMFIYYYWLYLYQKNVFFSYENGTTGIKNLDLNGFIETEPIIIPDMDTVHKFSEMCNNFEKVIFSNGYENEQLATLRDTLLPKLMSGEIDVSNIEIDDILGNNSTDKLSFSEVQ